MRKQILIRKNGRMYAKIVTLNDVTLSGMHFIGVDINGKIISENYDNILVFNAPELFTAKNKVFISTKLREYALDDILAPDFNEYFKEKMSHCEPKEEMFKSECVCFIDKPINKECFRFVKI